MSIAPTPAPPRKRSMSAAEFQEKIEARMSKRPRKPPPDARNAPGELRYVHKSQLAIDPSYQREPVDHKIRTIADGWDWHAVGVLSVARRDGKLFIFDGQYRYRAACLRPDVQELPCSIWDTASSQQEAGSFLVVNLNRRSLSSLDRFKAQVHKQDADSALLTRLIDEAGYKLVPNPKEDTRETKAVGSCLRYIRRNREAFLRAWPLIVETARGGIIQQKTILAINYLEHQLSKAGQSLHDEPWRARLALIDSKAIIDACNRACGYLGKGGDTIYGLALLDKINALGKRKLSLPTAKGRSAILGSSGKDPGEDRDEAIPA